MILKILRVLCGSVALALLVLATGCVVPPAKPNIDGANAPASLDQVVSRVVDDLARQLAAQDNVMERLARASGKAPRKSLSFDAFVDGASGQRTALAGDFQRRLITRLGATHPEFQLIPLSADSLRQTDLLLVGTISLEGAGLDTVVPQGSPAGVQVSIVSRGKSSVVARASGRVRNDGLDLTPSRLDQESPVVSLDRYAKGQARTAAARVGEAADPVYLGGLRAAVSIGAGQDEYEAGRYAEAAKHFSAALEDPTGERLLALNGSYMSSIKQGQFSLAEGYFSRIVKLGLTDRNLNVRFLFKPGSTDFWPDPQVTGQYDMWIRQISRGIEQAKACVELVGHASHTGPEALNNRLSEQRALVIRQRLQQQMPQLASMLTTKGMGFHKNIIGTGTDDSRDALDRRVEFVVGKCG